MGSPPLVPNALWKLKTPPGIVQIQRDPKIGLTVDGGKPCVQLLSSAPRKAEKIDKVTASVPPGRRSE